MARGVGVLGGVVSGTENAAGGLVVTSTGTVDGVDFASYVKLGLQRGGAVNILTGVHGEADGALSPALHFFEQDVAMYGSIEGVTVHNMTDLSADAIIEMLKGSGTTIGAFCNSGICLQAFIDEL
jgi:hypothetical protein